MKSSTKKIVILVIIVILAAAAAVTVFLTREKAIDGNTLLADVDAEEGEKVLLVDYYYAVVATVGGDRYDETVLYQNRDGSCEVHYYSKADGDKEESHSFYKVDPGVIDAAYDIINKNRIATWNDREFLPGMEGAVCVLKFRGNNNECIRVTSENCPDDGVSIMYSVAEVLNQYAAQGTPGE